ncbi:MAG: YraN family protein [Clostridiales bacterium]|nr:YraN family protein [Clostridiales bacterium]
MTIDDDNSKKTLLRKIGDRGEDAVAQYLTKRGFRLIARNYNIPGVGELDLVFEKEGVLYVTEVKSRRNQGPYPHSVEAVDFRKRKRIFRTTKRFMAERGYFNRDIVFLLGSVTHDEHGQVQRVEVVQF